MGRRHFSPPLPFYCSIFAFHSRKAALEGDACGMQGAARTLDQLSACQLKIFAVQCLVRHGALGPFQQWWGAGVCVEGLPHPGDTSGVSVLQASPPVPGMGCLHPANKSQGPFRNSCIKSRYLQLVVHESKLTLARCYCYERHSPGGRQGWLFQKETQLELWCCDPLPALSDKQISS